MLYLLREDLREERIDVNGSAFLEDYTTFHIGGRAALLAQPATVQQLAFCIRCAKNHKTPYMIMGNGSNLLFPDEGYQGLVIRIGEFFSMTRIENEETLICDAGTPLAAACMIAAQNGLTGMEFAYGIPGSVGGAVYMNAGAYGGEMSDIVTQIRYLTNDLKCGITSKEEAAFGYRDSLFQHKPYYITEVTFSLKKGERAKIEECMKEIKQKRREKQPLNRPSAGSTFKRPQGGYAAQLIDQCGLKGFQIGHAAVSEKHAGFIINAGGASYADVVALIEYVQKTVKEKTGIWLEPEVQIIR